MTEFLEAPYSKTSLENSFTKHRMDVRAMVDSGSVFLTVPEHVAIQLGFDLQETSTREVVLADGSRRNVPMICPLRVRFADRYCGPSALVLGDEPLFGVVPMEMMGLVLHPSNQTLMVNPTSPYVPTALAK